DHDGVCDATVCKGVKTLVRGDDPGYGRQFDSVRKSVLAVGLTLKPHRFADANAFYGQLLDPTAHTPWGINDGWFSDYLNGSNWFGPLVSGAGLGRDTNAALIGASDGQLRGWGYKATGVPSLDVKIDDCLRRAGVSQDLCWAEADQFLMERVVPWIPIMSQQVSRLTSARVATFSFDESTTAPALDQLSLK